MVVCLVTFFVWVLDQSSLKMVVLLIPLFSITFALRAIEVSALFVLRHSTSSLMAVMGAIVGVLFVLRYFGLGMKGCSVKQI